MFSVLALFTTALAGAEPPAQQLTITAAIPKVAIAPQDPGRQFLPLPALDFDFLLEPRCAAGWSPQSMTLSIADSRTVLDAKLLDEHGLLRTRLAVPAAQLAPLPISGFCEAAPDAQRVADNNAELKYPAALSAHAALICGNDDAEKISYASRPLGLILRCTAESPAPGE